MVYNKVDFESSVLKQVQRIGLNIVCNHQLSNNMMLELFVLLAAFSDSGTARNLHRIHRRQINFNRPQTPGYFSPITVPGSGGFNPYNVPVGYNPALFSNPDTKALNLGVDVNPGKNYNLGGGLRFPLINNQRGTFIPFELDGNLLSGHSNIGVDYGHAVKGVNPLDLPFSEIYPCLFGMCHTQAQTVVLPAPVSRAQLTQIVEATPGPRRDSNPEPQVTFPTIEPKRLIFKPNPEHNRPNEANPHLDRFGVGGQVTRKPRVPSHPESGFVGILTGDPAELGS